MPFKKILLGSILTVSVLGHSAAADTYYKTPERMSFRLSEAVTRGLDASTDEIRALNRQLFVFIDGTCQNPFVPCNCTFEGFRASCDLVLACLSSGLCVADN